MKKVIVIAACLLTSYAFAGALNITEYEGEKSSQTPKTAKLNDIELKKIGSGVRVKKVLFLGFDVYQATLMGSDDSFLRDTKETRALDSLQGMKAAAIHLKLMRSLSANDIVKSFETALIENNVKDSPALTQFKEAIKNGGAMSEGDVVSISMDKEKGVLICEQGKTVTEIKGDAKLFRDVFSIWLGKTGDSGLTALREKLIMGV